MGINIGNEMSYKKVTVGFKYCGGCNPRYNRVAKVEEFKLKHPEFNYITIENIKSCEFWFIICGCKAACASVSELKATNNVIVIDSEEKFSEINAFLNI